MIKVKDYWQAESDEQEHVRLYSAADCAWCGAYPRVSGPYCEECASDRTIRHSTILERALVKAAIAYQADIESEL